jgi:hypothetical protein
VTVAGAPRHHARSDITACLVRERGERRCHQRHFDVLAGATRASRLDRRQDADRRVEAGDDVDERHADLQRSALAFAGDAHQSARGLDEQVVARQVAASWLRPETRDRCVDNSRIRARDVVVADPEVLGGTWLEVLEHDVGASSETLGEPATGRVDEVERHAALVAVESEEVRRLAHTGITCAVDRVVPRRAPLARLVAGSRPFDFDDVGAEVAEQHADERTRENPREVGHEQAGERSGHRRSLRTELQHVHDPGGVGELVVEQRGFEWESPSEAVERTARADRAMTRHEE